MTHVSFWCFDNLIKNTIVSLNPKLICFYLSTYYRLHYGITWEWSQAEGLMGYNLDLQQVHSVTTVVSSLNNDSSQSPVKPDCWRWLHLRSKWLVGQTTALGRLLQAWEDYLKVGRSGYWPAAQPLMFFHALIAPCFKPRLTPPV